MRDLPDGAGGGPAWTEATPGCSGWFWVVQAWEGRRIDKTAPIELAYVSHSPDGPRFTTEDDLFRHGDEGPDWTRIDDKNFKIERLWFGPVEPPPLGDRDWRPE